MFEFVYILSSDSDYEAFLEELNKKVEPFPSAEVYVEEMEQNKSSGNFMSLLFLFIFVNCVMDMMHFFNFFATHFAFIAPSTFQEGGVFCYRCEQPPCIFKNGRYIESNKIYLSSLMT